MPSDTDHFAAAARNQALLTRLMDEVQQYPDWVAVVAFYKAMHIVEAVLFQTHGDKHTFSHEQRNGVLKSNRRYAHLHKHYWPLFNASLVARYMEVGRGAEYPKFTDYMTPAQVQSDLIRHYLHQVEQGASRLLISWPAEVPRCVPPAVPPSPPS